MHYQDPASAGFFLLLERIPCRVRPSQFLQLRPPFRSPSSKLPEQFFRDVSFGLASRLQVGANQGNTMSFSTLGLDASLLENITRLGYTEPTPVQREAIPAVLSGGDLLVSSQTGSGKTAAFVLPGLQRLRTE